MRRQALPVAVFLPPAGPSAGERWMASARRAACQDTILRLQATGRAEPILLLAAEAEDRQALRAAGVTIVEDGQEQGDFHFGRALARSAQTAGAGPLAYFGGASAPLMSTAALAAVLAEACESAGQPVAWVNNLLSTDWAVLADWGAFGAAAATLAADNPLGWRLGRQPGSKVIALPASAATQADIDTPADALLMARHAGLGPELGAFLDRSEAAGLLPKVDALRSLLQTPASTLAIIGRTSSSIWQAIERRKQVWVRLFAEERGMLASGRAERGEVRSLLGELLDDWGPVRFVERLSAIADGVLWDNRVWMAQRGLWPTAADRFAADLGRSGEVAAPDLAALTEAIQAAPIPILTGGHSLVSGSLMALIESLDPVPGDPPAA
jgi:CTP:molybdopterin cytidylyltransferase MocA